MRYSQSRITFKHYGKYTQQFVARVARESKASDVTREMVNIARYMRTKSYEYNNEHPNNDAIVRDIRTMANGNIEVDLSMISSMRSEYRANAPQRNAKRGKQQQNRNNGRKMTKGAKPQQRHGAHGK